MRILVLGGTRFIGRHIVARLLGLGAQLTVLHRGWSASPFGDEADHLIDDRRALSAHTKAVLAKPWDAVIDTSGHDLDHVAGTTRTLGPIGVYLYVSTCGVYARPKSPASEVTERSPVLRRAGVLQQHVSALRKLQCERYLERELDSRGVPLVVARLGVTVGPFDQADRFAYWLEHALQGGETLVPMHPDQDIQLIDVRDVADFVAGVVVAQRKWAGTFNVSGPRITAAAVVDMLVTAVGDQLHPRWVGEQFALAHQLMPWTEVPLWLSSTHPDRSLMAGSCSKAQAAGLRYRPFAETIRDSLEWRAAKRCWNSVWLDRDRELALLSKWRTL